jgi:ribosomal protein S12 methylthiotransferase
MKVGLISLGCAKNLVDSEVMLGTLQREGLELTHDSAEADVILVNTCGFIEGAKQESIDTILKAAKLRENGQCRALIVAGCLTQRYPKELHAEIPEVDAFIGLNEVPRIGEIVRGIIGRGESDSCGSGFQPRPVGVTNPSHKEARLFWSGSAKYVPDFAAPRVRLTPPHWAYVKIAEGCNHPCTFCSIPRIRGKHRSRTVADVVAEARALVAGGTKELNLISQDTTFYGRDWPSSGTPSRSAAVVAGSAEREGVPLPLCELLRELQSIPGDFWIRLLYTHPAHWTDELIATIAACDKVCRYVDMPLQHINDAMLTAMRRETDGAYIRDLIARIRAGVPGIALRTTFIVGYPGETEPQFAELLEFIEAARFERLGVFAYSQEDHTPAGNLKAQMPVKVREQRRKRAMALQQHVSRDILQGCVGRTVRVLVDKPGVGRSAADAPEIDGSVQLTGKAAVGEFTMVKITGAKEYDLQGVVAA